MATTTTTGTGTTGTAATTTADSVTAQTTPGENRVAAVMTGEIAAAASMLAAAINPGIAR